MTRLQQGTFAFLLLLAVSLTGGCQEKVSDEEIVAQTAKLYYDYLLEGKYEDFVAGIDHHLQQADDYNKQLLTSAKMFMALQKERHQGVSSFSVVNADIEEGQQSHNGTRTSSTANVFLVIHYADNTDEQIVVPMVERDGIWLMR